MRANFYLFFFNLPEIVRKWFVKPVRDQRVKQKGTAVFECEIAKDTPNIKWFKGDQEIPMEPNDKIEIKKVGKILTLIVKNADPDDIGEYTVEVEGQASSANLIVDGKSSVTCRNINIKIYSLFHYWFYPC